MTKLNLKQNNKKRSGASSVLILFTVVILITLGLFTIVSASLNYKLSVESSQWNEFYYELDSVGESLVAKIDDVLYSAEQKAVYYVLTSEYKSQYARTISQEIHDINLSVYNNDINNTYDVMNNTYKSLVIEYLKDIEDEYGGKVVTLYNKDGSVFSIYYTNVLSHSDDENYQLTINLNIEDILYDIFISDSGEVTGRKIDFKNRYLINRWKQHYNVVE